MKLPRKAMTGMMAAAMLTACSTSEVLTPPMEVGDGGQPVTDSNLSLASQSGGSYSSSTASYPVENSSISANSYTPGPQNTLEAQAAALQYGHNPVASAPLSGDAGSYPQAPSASYQQPQQPLQQQPMQQQSVAAQQPQSAAPANVAALPPAAAGTIRFLPIIGAPVQAVTPLSRQLGAEARARGLTIKPSSDPASEHILKGYFSAFGDGGNVTIVYVWDVLDASGGRLHRIQGQETLKSASKDPWEAVPASLMQQIATKTIAEYVNWRDSQRS
ncbi:hypothetical protein G6N76_03060 [Rhizobium daejeonense]|uniref:Lipoprotein n=1 Tax=Rhizobium daejeonense TaxID=240521 RepID=A0A6M1S0P0_9HYPH|nr:hypothetical protein [Rhizobium daejeonense]NGO62640.1 hypothetical protein [Rhizobium daejeonense]